MSLCWHSFYVFLPHTEVLLQQYKFIKPTCMCSHTQNCIELSLLSISSYGSAGSLRLSKCAIELVNTLHYEIQDGQLSFRGKRVLEVWFICLCIIHSELDSRVILKCCFKWVKVFYVVMNSLDVAMVYLESLLVWRLASAGPYSHRIHCFAIHTFILNDSAYSGSIGGSLPGPQCWGLKMPDNSQCES